VLWRRSRQPAPLQERRVPPRCGQALAGQPGEGCSGCESLRRDSGPEGARPAAAPTLAMRLEPGVRSGLGLPHAPAALPPLHRGGCFCSSVISVRPHLASEVATTFTGGEKKKGLKDVPAWPVLCLSGFTSAVENQRCQALMLPHHRLRSTVPRCLRQADAWPRAFWRLKCQTR